MIWMESYRRYGYPDKRLHGFKDESAVIKVLKDQFKPTFNMFKTRHYNLLDKE